MTTTSAPGDRLGVILMLVGFGLGAVPVFLGVLNHDVAWYLHASGRLMAGDRLYVDLIETNPPLIVWLNLLPRALARVLGISEVVTLRLMVLGLVAASLLAIRRILLPSSSDQRSVLLLSLLVLLPMAGGDFAQREHLLLILFLPYLIMASARSEGTVPLGGLAWAVGLMASLGVALKPHFVLPWLAVEGSLAATRRADRPWTRPETLAVVSFGLAYAVAVVAITPEYLTMIRWAAPVYAASGKASIEALATQPGTVVTVMAVFGFLALRSERAGRVEGLGVIAVADLGFLTIAVLQDKGYPYHFYPPMAIGVLLIGRLASRSIGPRMGGPSRVIMVTLRGVLAVMVLVVAADRVRDSMIWRGRPGDSDTTLGRMIRVAKAHAGVGRVFTFSTAVAASFPMVVEADVGWASRHPALWFLPAYDHDVARPPASMDPTERALFDSVVDTLLADRPALLFVDETEQPAGFRGRRFRFLDYYAVDPRFSRFLHDYEPFDSINSFRVYRRRPGPSNHPSAWETGTDSGGTPPVPVPLLTSPVGGRRP